MDGPIATGRGPARQAPGAPAAAGAGATAGPGAGRPTTHVVVGALLGLAWAAGLRGWMAQLAGPDSTFSWLGTFVGILLPGAVVGGLLAWADHLRRGGGRPRWLVAAPLLFPVAVLSQPGAITTLATTGEGSAAIGVALLAMLAGAAVGSRGSLWWRVPAGLVGFALVPAAYLGPPMRPELDPATPLGAWAATTFSALFVILALACAIPLRPAAGPPGHRRARQGVGLVLLGCLVGLAWSASLRGFMIEVAGGESSASWVGTFGWILAPGIVVGALLGWAEHLRRTGRHLRWLALAPLAFSAVLFSDPTDLTGILQDGIGGGAIGVPLLGMAGGYALGGRGRRWLRGLCGLLALSAIPIWALTATSIGGPAIGLDTPRGLWMALLYWSHLAVLCLGCAIPYRRAPVAGTGAGPGGEDPTLAMGPDRRLSS